MGECQRGTEDKHQRAIRGSSSLTEIELLRLDAVRLLICLIGRSRDDPGQAFTENGRAPVFFDVFDDQFDAARVADVWFVARVVECVSQVATKNNIFPQVFLLANPKRSAKHTHIGVNAHQDDVPAAFLFEKVIDLLSAVANAIVADDLDSRVFVTIVIPVWFRVGVVAAADVGSPAFDIVDNRPRSFFFGIVVAPALNRNGGV